MKRIFYCFLALIPITYSCDKYLDIVPDNVATLDYAFLDRTSAEKFLATCYQYLPNLGVISDDPAIQGSDEFWGIEEPHYGATNYRGMRMRKGELNVEGPIFNYWDGEYGGKPLFRAIRDCNIFLENIVQLEADLSEEEKLRWISEVKFLKAYYHFYLLRMYGSIPMQKNSIDVNAGIDEVRVYRDPFDEVVEYIVELLDEAVIHLPIEIANRATELGRITKPIALALKAEVLTTAASPLFNGNPDFLGFLDKRGEKLFSNVYDSKKWERAAKAAKNAIDTAVLAGHKLYQFEEYPTALSDSTRLLMTLRHVFADKWNEEIIWTEAKLNLQSYMYATAPYFLRDYNMWTPSDPYMIPDLKMAELFYTNNGVPIDEDINFDYTNRFHTVNAPVDHRFFVESNYRTANLNINRETRFYANLAFDGSVWFGNGRVKDVGRGNLSEQPWVFKTKKGEVQGKNGSLRYSLSGYWIRKSSHFENVTTSATSKVTVRSTFPIIRLADLYLLYAEALNESLSAPDERVYEAINIVRRRAGLNGVVESWASHSKYPNKPYTKEGFREIVQQERMIELAFEGKRFWDVRRWKTAPTWYNQPVRGLNADGETAAEFNTVKILFTPRFRNREYLFPIKEYNLRVNKNLIQNPNW